MAAVGAAAADEAQKLYAQRVAECNGKANAMLYRALRGPSCVTVLSLQNTYVGDVGVVALGQVMHLLPNLVVLDLKKNGVSNAACPVLRHGCSQTPRLRALDLSGNKLITRKGGRELLELISGHPELLWIGVSDTMVSNYYATRLTGHRMRKCERLADAERDEWNRYFDEGALPEWVEGAHLGGGSATTVAGASHAVASSSALTSPPDDVEADPLRNPATPGTQSLPAAGDAASPKAAAVAVTSPASEKGEAAAAAAALAPHLPVPPSSYTPPAPALTVGHASPTPPAAAAAAAASSSTAIDGFGVEPSTTPPPKQPWQRSDRPLSSHSSVLSDRGVFMTPAPPAVGQGGGGPRRAPPPPPPPAATAEPAVAKAAQAPQPPSAAREDADGDEDLTMANLYNFFHAYKPKQVDIPTPFKFPGKLNYIPAVGGPDPFTGPPTPDPEVTAPANVPLGLADPTAQQCYFWSYLMSCPPGGRGALPPMPPNPHDDMDAAVRQLQEDIYFANIAPPQAFGADSLDGGGDGEGNVFDIDLEAVGASTTVANTAAANTTPAAGDGGTTTSASVDVSSTEEEDAAVPNAPEAPGAVVGDDAACMAAPVAAAGAVAVAAAVAEGAGAGPLSQPMQIAVEAEDGDDDERPVSPKKHALRPRSDVVLDMSTLAPEEDAIGAGGGGAMDTSCRTLKLTQILEGGVGPTAHKWRDDGQGWCDGMQRVSDMRCFNTVTAMVTMKWADPANPQSLPSTPTSAALAPAVVAAPAPPMFPQRPPAERRVEGTGGGGRRSANLAKFEAAPPPLPTRDAQLKAAINGYLSQHSLHINLVQPLRTVTEGPHAVVDRNRYAFHRVIKPTQGGLTIDRLTSGSLNNNGSLLATGSYDLTAKIWDGITGEHLHTLTGHEGYVYDVIWNAPHCDRLVTASFDKTCKVWQADTGKCEHTLVGHELEVVCVCINRASTLIASGSMDRTTIVWSALTGSQISQLHGHLAEIVCIDFSPSSDKLVSGSADETVRLWHPLTGEPLAVFEGHRGEVSAVKFNCWGNLILSCSADSTCNLWHVATKRGKALKGHSKDVSDCEFSSDGWLVASGSEDMSARVWDTLSAGCIAMMKGHTAGICCVTFNKEGTELLTGSADQSCRRWKVSTGECLQVLGGHQGVVISSFCVDNSTILTISKDNTCRLWRRNAPDTSLREHMLQYVTTRPLLKARAMNDPRMPPRMRARLEHAECSHVTYKEHPPEPTWAVKWIDEWRSPDTSTDPAPEAVGA